MNELERRIRAEIARAGPLRFDRFMEVALYDAELGYYRRGRDPFGVRGDYFTSSQLQPAFGRLIGRQLEQWDAELGHPRDFTVVELGAGRGETAREVRAALPHIRYIEVEQSSGELPDRMTGVVFSNEFFDALPVRVARDGRERSVGLVEDRLAFVDGPACDGDLDGYLRRFAPNLEPGQIVEVSLEALRWIERIAGCLDRGLVLTIDYGYRARELVRFPEGTLMSYRRHAASGEVLADPGERDLTAHVNWTALAARGAELGLDPEPLRTQLQFLLSIGEADDFRSVLDLPGGRGQLKTLLAGMGETFQVLVQRKR